MSESEQDSGSRRSSTTPTGTTEHESVTVRAEVVELDAAGRVIARQAHDGLGWEVDPKSLEGDPGELATRPKREAS
jgi:hypothetical protein